METDKAFWHGYVDFYDVFLKRASPKKIVEFGVFRGGSIRWLMDKFPEAEICGVDILDVQPEWPVSPKVRYHQLDQGNRRAIDTFFADEMFDLIIEDGSHRPQHQVSCLIEGMKHLSAGGIYILEDIHTSMRSGGTPRSFGRAIGLADTGNALTVLLAIHHLKRIGEPITNDRAMEIAANSLFTPKQVLEMSSRIKAIHLYRRTRLPDRCYKCGSVHFDYSALRCKCSIELFKSDDSMSFVIEA